MNKLPLFSTMHPGLASIEQVKKQASCRMPGTNLNNFGATDSPPGTALGVCAGWDDRTTGRSRWFKQRASPISCARPPARAEEQLQRATYVLVPLYLQVRFAVY